jgi:hypothetical protein
MHVIALYVIWWVGPFVSRRDVHAQPLFLLQGIEGQLLEPDTGVWVEEALERSDMGPRRSLTVIPTKFVRVHMVGVALEPLSYGSESDRGLFFCRVVLC